jgi:hypothetical protein
LRLLVYLDHGLKKYLKKLVGKVVAKVVGEAAARVVGKVGKKIKLSYNEFQPWERSKTSTI